MRSVIPQDEQFQKESLGASRYVARLEDGDSTVEGLRNEAVSAEEIGFNARYAVEQGELLDTQYGCAARDLSTGQRVFLKFVRLSEQLERVKHVYDALQNSKHVCKIIRMLPKTEDASCCLVLEHGSYTLAQRLEGRPLSPIEQQSIVFSILEALRDLHSREVVHGNLDPSSVVWSATDFCWKFLVLDSATFVGDPLPLQNRTNTRYTAPEIQQALKFNEKSALCDESIDLWSFGLMAFEIFTGTSILDSHLVKRYVNEERSRLAEHIQRDTAFETSLSGTLLKSAVQRLREFELIDRMLAERRIERPSALQALGADVFGPPPEPKDPMKELEEFFCGRGTLNTGTDGPPKWAVCYLASNHLDFSVEVERFAQHGLPEAAFHQQDAVKAKKFMDDYLPKHPVHVIPVGESFRILISISRDNQLRFPLEKVSSVQLQTPDGETKPLDYFQQNGENKLDVFALVNPSKFYSQRLNTKCPIFGLVDTKYVRLTVHMKLHLGHDFPYDMDAYSTLYLQLKRPPRRFGLFKSDRDADKPRLQGFWAKPHECS